MTSKDVMKEERALLRMLEKDERNWKKEAARYDKIIENLEKDEKHVTRKKNK